MLTPEKRSSFCPLLLMCARKHINKSLLARVQGERLSHAVGCAFAECLEKKQKREKEGVSATYTNNGTTFARDGSFRVKTLTEQAEENRALQGEWWRG